MLVRAEKDEDSVEYDYIAWLGELHDSIHVKHLRKCLACS